MEGVQRLAVYAILALGFSSCPLSGDRVREWLDCVILDGLERVVPRYSPWLSAAWACPICTGLPMKAKASQPSTRHSTPGSRCSTLAIITVRDTTRCSSG